MSKYLISLLIVGLSIFSVFPLEVAATPITLPNEQALIIQLQAKIQELQKMINALKAQIEAQRTNQNTASAPEFGWTSGLKPGQRDTEKLGPVLKLQVLLKEKGYADFVPTGYYGPKTAEAVKRLQYELGVLPEFKSPGVTEKADYLEKLADQKIIPPTVTDVSSGLPTVMSSGQFDPCFKGTAPKEMIDKCVQEKLGYGTVGPKTTAAIEEKLMGGSGGSPAPTTAVAKLKECKGDLSQDGLVDFSDINPYTAYYNKHQSVEQPPDELFWFADINNDSILTQGDINLFVGILSGTVKPICR